MEADFEIARFSSMMAAIKNHPADGVIWEDEQFLVERKQGVVYMTGKPFRECFIYRQEADAH